MRHSLNSQEVRLHDLRHSYSSFLDDAGRSPYEVQKRLGHHDPKVTLIYAQLSPQAMLGAINVVRNVVGRRWCRWFKERKQ